MSSGSDKINLAIFASGSGSNAEAIIKYFKNHPFISVKAIFCNNKNAAVIERSEKSEVPVIIFGKEKLYESEEVITILMSLKIDWIILAGFLWLIPNSLLKAFPDRIINIHPSLLPKYGGNGMFGKKVHEAVIINKEKTSGISIHLLNEKYDEGKIIFQASTEIFENETPEMLAAKILLMEHRHYPEVIEQWILKQKK